MSSNNRILAGMVLLACIPLAARTRGPRNIIMATTTSTDNSGLLQILLPAFRTETGITVHVVAVGSGKALKLGENGDVDLVLAHARASEEEFMRRGFGVDRREVMYNDFVLAGSGRDPAAIRKAANAREALERIAARQPPFISRGDGSGTHQMENGIWRAAKIRPSGRWYLSAGQGMGAVLTMADEKQAYTLTDRGTFVAMESRLGLEILFEGDTLLHNPYGVIAVNPARWPHAQYESARRFIEWITSPAGQDLISGFTVNGKRLFHPLSGISRQPAGEPTP